MEFCNITKTVKRDRQKWLQKQREERPNKKAKTEIRNDDDSADECEDMNEDLGFLSNLEKSSQHHNDENDVVDYSTFTS